MTTHEVAARFNELAQQEKMFEIQDELYADNVTTMEPSNSPYFKPFQHTKGKSPVRKKGEAWVEKVEAVHETSTTEPVVAGNHFAVGRVFDITVKGFGRIKIEEIMLFEVKDGKIISEQFFY